MALSLDVLKAQTNVVGNADDGLLARLLTAATKHTERQLGYDLDDEDVLPDGAPEDLEHGVYMLAAHWFENREATIVGVSSMAVPMGYAEIIAEHRRYTFGLCEDADDE